MLKFYTEFEHMTPERSQKFKVKGSKVNVTARHKWRKNSKSLNNSAGGCPISIKFSTDYDQVPADLLQTFKVNGSKVKVIV